MIKTIVCHMNNTEGRNSRDELKMVKFNIRKVKFEGKWNPSVQQAELL